MNYRKRTVRSLSIPWTELALSTLIGHSGIGKQAQPIGPLQRTQVEATNRRVRLTAWLGTTLNGKQV